MDKLKQDVLIANTAFYTAFNEKDVTGMEALWAGSEDIACVHPGWGALRGREQVLGSWEAILSSMDSPLLNGTNETVHITGDTAFVVCDEAVDGEEPQLVATNVFVRSEGSWRLLHHHASPIIQVVESVDSEDEEASDANDTVLH